jgi:hypothetical protein
MLYEITTMKDVKTFIEQIAHEIDNFHPLEDFTDYVYPDSYFRKYTDEEAEIRNKLLDKCFDVCAYHTEDFFSYLIWYFDLQRACMMIEQV